MEKAKGPKDNTQQIRLCLNLIAPNNFDKKMGELREMLIGDVKILNEQGFDEEKQKDMKIPEIKLDAVV